jgi:hypothetical protein
VARGATRRPGQAVGARGRALRLGPEPRPCCQGAGDTAAPVEAAVGAARATVDDAAGARGVADETRRRARSVPHRLAPGGDRGLHRQRYVQLSPRSRQAAASPIARRPLSAAHQPGRGRPRHAVGAIICCWLRSRRRSRISRETSRSGRSFTSSRPASKRTSSLPSWPIACTSRWRRG